MPFLTIVPISVGKDKDMARACDAIGPERRLLGCGDRSVVGQSRSRLRTLEMTWMTQFGSGVCVAAVETMMIV